MTLEVRQSVSAPEAPVATNRYYTALDGLRALAITMVFLDHYAGGSHGSLLLRILNQLRLGGWVGVDIFFVLSGFLITGILYDTRNDTHYFKKFYVRRSLRIFPVFYLVIFLCLVLTPFFDLKLQWGQLSFLVYAGNIFAIFNWSLYDLPSRSHQWMSISLSHFWTLFIEEQFYLIWPFIVYKLRDRVKLLRFCGIAIVGILLLRITLVACLSRFMAETLCVRLLPTRADSLLMGGALALLLRGEHSEVWLSRCKWFFAIGLVSVLILFGVRRTAEIGDPYVMSIGFSLLAVMSVGLIGMAIQPSSLVFRIFTNRALRRVGKYSYGFYIYHLLFRWAWIFLLVRLYYRLHSLALAGLIEITTCFLFTLLISALSYEYFEAPFLRLKSRFAYD